MNEKKNFENFITLGSVIRFFGFEVHINVQLYLKLLK